MQNVDRVYTELKRKIVDFEIPPGEKIHLEEMAKKLNVSVTPIREALNRLLNEGFLHRGQSRGFYNRSIDIEELTDLFQLRGTIAISAVHVVMRTELRKNIPLIIQSSEGDAVNSIAQMPICENLVNFVGNREMIRLYSNIVARIGFIWGIYLKSTRGSEAVRRYREELCEALRAENLSACVDCIDNNVRQQIEALESVVREGHVKLITERFPVSWPRITA